MKRWKESNWCACKCALLGECMTDRPSRATMRVLCVRITHTYIHIQLKVEMDRKWLIKSRRFSFVMLLLLSSFILLLCCCFFFILSRILCSYSSVLYFEYYTHSTMPFRWVKEEQVASSDKQHMNQIYMITYHNECSTLKLQERTRNFNNKME